jgi:hypothetical protein
MFRLGTTKCAVCGGRSKTADYERVDRRFKSSVGDPDCDEVLCPRCGCINTIPHREKPSFLDWVRQEAKKPFRRQCPGCGVSDWPSQFSSVVLREERGDRPWYRTSSESTWEYQHIRCGHRWTEVHQSAGY